MMKVFIILLLTQFMRAEPIRPMNYEAGNSSTYEGGIQSSRWNAEDAEAVTGPNRRAAAYDAETGLKYGCHLTYCWRSCKKGEQIVKGKDMFNQYLVRISARTINGATAILEFV